MTAFRNGVVLGLARTAGVAATIAAAAMVPPAGAAWAAEYRCTNGTCDTVLERTVVRHLGDGNACYRHSIYTPFSWPETLDGRGRVTSTGLNSSYRMGGVHPPNAGREPTVDCGSVGGGAVRAGVRTDAFTAGPAGAAPAWAGSTPAGAASVLAVNGRTAVVTTQPRADGAVYPQFDLTLAVTPQTTLTQDSRITVTAGAEQYALRAVRTVSVGR